MTMQHHRSTTIRLSSEDIDLGRYPECVTVIRFLDDRADLHWSYRHHEVVGWIECVMNANGTPLHRAAVCARVTKDFGTNAFPLLK